MKPLLLNESTSYEVPGCLEVLLASLSEDTTEKQGPYTETDLLVVLLHLLIVETGFAPLDDSQENSKDGPGFSARRLSACRRMPQDWRSFDRSSAPDSESKILYAITYILPPFEEHHCRMVALPSVEALIVNLIVSGVDAKTHCICINPARYVTLKAGEDPTKARFQRLAELSLRVKNRLSSPLRSSILLEERVPHASLAGLPLELQLRIAGLLSGPDVMHIGATCRALRPLAEEPAVWRRLALRDFGPSTLGLGLGTMPEPDWLALYRLKYIERKAERVLQGEWQLSDNLLNPLITPLRRTLVDVMFSGHCLN